MLSRVQLDDITVRNEMLGTDLLAFDPLPQTRANLSVLVKS
jgi:hypothetical protein